MSLQVHNYVVDTSDWTYEGLIGIWDMHDLATTGTETETWVIGIHATVDDAVKHGNATPLMEVVKGLMNSDKIKLAHKHMLVAVLVQVKTHAPKYTTTIETISTLLDKYLKHYE